MPNKELVENGIGLEEKVAHIIRTKHRHKVHAAQQVIAIIASEIKNMQLPEYTNCKSPADRFAKAVATEVQKDTVKHILDLLGENT